MVSAHWSDRHVSREMMNEILACSVVKQYSCISRASEHWRRNPLQSSAKQEMGTGLPMRLAMMACEVNVKMAKWLWR